MSEKQPMAEAHEDKDGFLRRSDMTMRDYFAGQALEGMIADHTNLCLPLLAKQAYDIADAMLEVRK